jgi:hypothetical protein
MKPEVLQENFLDISNGFDIADRIRLRWVQILAPLRLTACFRRFARPNWIPASARKDERQQ